LLCCATHNCAEPSSQYGCRGEQWSASAGRLLDFSYAGYRAGADPIPSPPISANLKTSYGAKGDGRTDDTQALLNAISDAAGDQLTVLYLPPGEYVLSRRIDISKRVIIRGAGRNLTTLVLSASLTGLGGAWPGTSSPHTYGPALLNWWGTGKTDATTLMARVTRCVRVLVGGPVASCPICRRQLASG
jgi:hypothetical protein